jgi:L-asparaginase
MTKTARALIDAKINKTVVLVGAFSPAATRDSDADFNLGFALGCARALPAGVYIAMNGEIFDGAKARKNRAAGRFTTARLPTPPKRAGG